MVHVASRRIHRPIETKILILPQSNRIQDYLGLGVEVERNHTCP